MDTIEPTSNHLDCPNGEQACPIYDELNSLKQQVDQLTQQAHTDSLTGLFNKRHFEQALLQEIDRTQRTGQPTTLVLLDVDHFKSINDEHGHVCGDYVLKSLADIVLLSLRKLDIPCRYGGEEFAILLPSTPLLVALHVAERLRLIINERAFEWEGKKLEISASFGVETLLQGSKELPKEFVARVDQQLYRAKKEGRNCVRHGTVKRRTDHTVSDTEKDLLNTPGN
ncbi:diguanylate cyclase (GGDEF) domain-containing protein [Alteromonadaceae bacterium Bs31]|nr:diguanylate cyclase (GGDEF) domain-containing protein [Alteromonadaceae bacterium Bs31]